MKKADNFNPGNWLVENKITSQSRLNENQQENYLNSLLEKIFEEGIDSLSLEEKEYLDNVSKGTNSKTPNEYLQDLFKEWKNGEIEASSINDELFNKSLTTNGIPDPELLIRTSGEHRVSNFLLWQIAYSEFYFTDVLWPDFKKEDLFKAVLNYQSRERRFGLISDQISKDV